MDRRQILRWLSVMLGMALAALSLAVPVYTAGVAELHAGEDEVRLNAGDMLRLPLDTGYDLQTQVSVRLRDVTDAGDATLTLTLEAQGEPTAEAQTPLAGKRAQSTVQLTTETPVHGDTLCITLSGAGSVSLAGETGMPYVRCAGQKTGRNLTLLYAGLTLLLLSLTPAGKEARHA